MAWGIANAEDRFFARRLARGLGITVDELDQEERYVLLGLNDRWAWQGRRWIRLAAEEPSTVREVEFRCNGVPVDTAYEEPFYAHDECTWAQRGIEVRPGDRWTATIRLADGLMLERSAIQGNPGDGRADG